MILVTEANIKDRIKRILKKHKLFYFMPQSGIYGTAGIPDFVCCIKGKFLGIEAKSPRRGEGGLSTLQKACQKSILKAQGDYLVIYDDITLNKLKHYLEEKCNDNK